NPDRAFCDRREDRIPDRFVEEAGHLWVRLLEVHDNPLRLFYLLAGIYRVGCDGKVEEAENQQDGYADRFRDHRTLLSTGNGSRDPQIDGRDRKACAAE